MATVVIDDLPEVKYSGEALVEDKFYSIVYDADHDCFDLLRGLDAADVDDSAFVKNNDNNQTIPFKYNEDNYIGFEVIDDEKALGLFVDESRSGDPSYVFTNKSFETPYFKVDGSGLYYDGNEILYKNSSDVNSNSDTNVATTALTNQLYKKILDNDDDISDLQDKLDNVNSSYELNYKLTIDNDSDERKTYIKISKAANGKELQDSMPTSHLSHRQWVAEIQRVIIVRMM